MKIDDDNISCIILAGGEGKRVGGLDKGLVSYKNRPLIEHVIDNVHSQVDDIIISANRNIKKYNPYAAKVLNDSASDYRGPLAGIAACLRHCRHDMVLVLACDMPELPADLVDRLTSSMHQNTIRIATVNGHHQLAMIINKNLSNSIQQHLDKNQLKLIQWVESVSYETVSFDDIADAFVNLNHLN